MKHVAPSIQFYIGNNSPLRNAKTKRRYVQESVLNDDVRGKIVQRRLSILEVCDLVMDIQIRRPQSRHIDWFIRQNSPTVVGGGLAGLRSGKASQVHKIDTFRMQ